MDVVKAVYLKPEERLASVRKEWHTRKRNGKSACYVIQDRCGKLLLVAQKLPVASSFINSNLVSPNEQWAKVTTNGLWEITNQTGGRVGGWHKGRFRVISVELEEASTFFESMRPSHEAAAVLGDSACYHIE
jgi:hypothetical protein